MKRGVKNKLKGKQEKLMHRFICVFNFSWLLLLEVTDQSLISVILPE